MANAVKTIYQQTGYVRRDFFEVLPWDEAGNVYEHDFDLSDPGYNEYYSIRHGGHIHYVDHPNVRGKLQDTWELYQKIRGNIPHNTGTYWDPMVQSDRKQTTNIKDMQAVNNRRLQKLLQTIYS